MGTKVFVEPFLPPAGSPCSNLLNDNILYHALAPPSQFPAPLPPFPLINSHPFGSARSSPGREAAKRTLDGEDRSDTIKREGKGGSRR